MSIEIELPLQDLMHRHTIPGLVAARRFSSGAVTMRAFGYRDVKSQEPMTAGTLMGIASCTKSFTALAICQLAEQGVLSLESPVVSFLPDFQHVRLVHGHLGDRVTLHHLLTHTAGLPDYSRLLNLRTKWASYTSSQQAYWREREPAIGPPILTVEDLLQAMAEEQVPPVGAPGERYFYSNEGYALLGNIVALVSGDSFSDYVTGHIFRPLGMTRSTLEVPGPAHAPVTRLYDPPDSTTGQAREIPAWPQAPATLGDGFVRTTVPELLRYLLSYLTEPPHLPSILGDPWRRQMVSPATLVGPETYGTPGKGYGYGWFLDEWRGHRREFHTGTMSGVGAYMGLVRDTGDAVVVLCNLTGGPAEAVADVLWNQESP